MFMKLVSLLPGRFPDHALGASYLTNLRKVTLEDKK
jgi:hypothetical protein